MHMYPPPKAHRRSYCLTKALVKIPTFHWVPLRMTVGVNGLPTMELITAVSSEGRAKLHDFIDLAVWLVRASCYSWAALSFFHSKPLYSSMTKSK